MFPDGTSSQGVSDHLLHLVMTPSTPKHGWQYLATQPVNHRFIVGTVWPRLPGQLPSHVALPEWTTRQCSFHVLPGSRGIPRSMHKCSAPFSFAVCGFPFPRPAVFAGVAIHSIPVATTEQHALWLGFLGVVGSLWSLLQRVRVP